VRNYIFRIVSVLPIAPVWIRQLQAGLFLGCSSCHLSAEVFFPSEFLRPLKADAKSSGSKIWRISMLVSPSWELGHRLTLSMARFERLDLQNQKPAMSSLAFAKGPSMKVRFLPEKWTRAPFVTLRLAALKPGSRTSSTELLAVRGKGSIGIGGVLDLDGSLALRCSVFAGWRASSRGAGARLHQAACPRGERPASPADVDCGRPGKPRRCPDESRDDVFQWAGGAL